MMTEEQLRTAAIVLKIRENAKKMAQFYEDTGVPGSYPEPRLSRWTKWKSRKKVRYHQYGFRGLFT